MRSEDTKNPMKVILYAAFMAILNTLVIYAVFVVIPYFLMKTFFEQIPGSTSSIYYGPLAFFVLYFIDNLAKKTPIRLIISMFQGVIILYILLSLLGGGILTGTITFEGLEIEYVADIRTIVYILAAFGFILPIMVSIVSYVEGRIKDTERESSW